jgi:hypothetical protein
MDLVGSVLVPILSTTVGAVVTYQAVKWTAQAETEREKRNQAALKRALILGLGEELEKIYGYVYQITSLKFGHNYALESRITEDTVAHQLELFNNPDLVERLSHLRFVLKKTSQGLELFRDPSISTRSVIFPNGITPDIWKNWGSYRDDCLNTIGELIALFDQEAPGLLDIKFDYIRNHSLHASKQ